MASSTASNRLRKEYKMLFANPPPLLTARPLESNILEWHFLLRGPPDTPYAGGVYWGAIKFPSEYPFKPPSLRMYTPSGRFRPGERICLSMSDFHPSTWNPAWSVSTILQGLQSFMVTEEAAAGTVAASVSERKIMARESAAWNAKQRIYREVFGEVDPNWGLDGKSVQPPQPSAPPAAAPSPAIDSSSAQLRQRSTTATALPDVAVAATATAQVEPQGSGLLTPTRIKWMLLVFAVWLYLLFSRLISRASTMHTI
ncbi:Ubiquitin-conjugating enzyme E2 6 [Sorochytrium milnesiophthora]